jgi:hypothetical protein
LSAAAVGDHQARRARRQQRREHALRRAARAHQQHARSRHRAPEIDRQVAQQPDAVRVVAAHLAAVETSVFTTPAVRARFRNASPQ